jgi:phosphoadenosine phosphosulfate reductase
MTNPIRIPEESPLTNPATIDRSVLRLTQRYGHLSAPDLLAVMVLNEFSGRIALASSFGAESAVLLHMVAGIDRNLPVLFLDTGKLFGETLRYRDRLIDRLGLTAVVSIKPDPGRLHAEDSDGTLWQTNPDRCCYLRKVRPLEDALAGFEAWITGRKRFQGASRHRLASIEATSTHVKVNPLAGWTKSDLDDYLDNNDLPRHPLVEDGFLSIGCMPCTDRVAPGADPRSARWAGSEKTECGIHMPLSAPGGDD